MYDLHIMEREAREIIKDKTNNIRLLHCRSYISAHVGLYCQQKFGIPWIFDMRGFYADERVECGLWRQSNPIYRMVYRYFKQIEKKCITQAAHIVSLSHNGANEIRSVIPCCTDMQLFHFEKVKSSQEALRKKLQIAESAFVLSYLGSFGTWYMTDEMFDFFKVVYDKNPNAIFLCITPDSADKLESLAMRKDIPRSALRVYRANREDVPAYAALSDWSMFFIKPVYSKKASSPTKMGELLSLGIPIVCNTGVGDVDSIMAECPQGFVLQEYTQSEYARVADGMLQASAPNREALRAVAETYYSLEKGAAQYAEIYKAIVG
jgi:glycosyltransferase involved in cell wall biosynthesis